MQPTTATHKSGSSTDAPLLDSAYCHLGIDTTGAAHCWHAPTNTVHVIYEGRRRQRIALDAVADFASVDDYMHELERRRGWASREFGFDAFLDRLAAAVER
jgi:hypothetical protein